MTFSTVMQAKEVVHFLEGNSKTHSMAQTKKPKTHDTIQQLQAEVERLRRRLAEMETGEARRGDATTSPQADEQKYSNLLEHLPITTYLLGAGNEQVNPTLYVSPQIEQISGYTSEQFLNDPHFWLHMIHPDDRAHVMASGERADRTGEQTSIEYRVIGRDGKIFWVRDDSTIVKNNQDEPLYRVGVWTNITKSKQAEIALRQLEDRYRRAIDAAGAVPYILDHDTFTFTFIGEGILQMTGYSAAEMTSGIWNSIILEGVPRGKLAHLTFEEADRATDEDHSLLWECDFRIRTRDGQIRWIADTSVKGIDEQSGRLVAIGIKQDITERKLAETMRESLIHELEQRNAELERFAYTLSHELKSPLITIRGFMGYLREDALNGNITRLDRDLKRISEGSDNMLKLINELIDLMSVGRIENDFREISLREVVDEALELFGEKIAQQHINVQVAGHLPRVFGDRQRLLEVFQNLLDNSINFMGSQPEPKIEIGVRGPEAADPVVYIRDNGIGIDPRFNERIFGIFHKLDSSSAGTGIGLALVKRIIEMHGGRVWVESEGIGKGSTFCFTLPTKASGTA